MYKTDVDKLLGKNPSRRRKILLEFAKQPSGVANKVMAETLHIDHSDLVNQHLSVFEEFGVIRKCDVVVKRPMGRVRTLTEISMKGYRLNHDAFATLLNIFVGTDHLEDFLNSPYVSETEGTTVFLAIINAISDHMEPVQALAKMIGLPSPEAHFSQRRSQMMSSINELPQMMSQMMSSIKGGMIRFEEVASTLPPHSTVGEVFDKIEEEEERHNYN